MHSLSWLLLLSLCGNALTYTIGAAGLVRNPLRPSAFFLRSDVACYGGRNRRPSVLHSTRISMMTAGMGFGAPQRKLKLEYGGSKIDKQEQMDNWKTQYQSLIKRMGKYLTAMSWEGHKRHGRGAIYANNRARPPVVPGVPAYKTNKLAGAPTMYVPLSKYSERKPRSEQEKNDMDQILVRIQTYNPEKEFVVIFEGAGLMGADVVKPSISPPELHRLINPDEYGMATKDDEDDAKVLAEYWMGGSAAEPAKETAEESFIDMSSLIAEAQSSADGVIDIDIGKVVDEDTKRDNTRNKGGGK